MLHNGRFSENTRANSFSRVGVDMALEKAINVEAKRLLKRMMAYADVTPAVNRWDITNSMKNHFVNSLLELADLNHTSDGNKELRKSRQEKDK